MTLQSSQSSQREGGRVVRATLVFHGLPRPLGDNKYSNPQQTAAASRQNQSLSSNNICHIVRCNKQSVCERCMHGRKARTDIRNSSTSSKDSKMCASAENESACEYFH